MDRVSLPVRVPGVHAGRAALQDGGSGRRFRLETKLWEDFTPTLRLDQINKGMSIGRGEKKYKDRTLEPSKNKSLRREGA